MAPPRAVLFDFNGTLSQDEPILCAIAVELSVEIGKPMSAREYYDRLAGLSDAEIARTLLGREDPRVGWVIEQRVARYRAAVTDGSSVPVTVRAAVRYAAARVPVGIVSGATRAEIGPVVEGAGLGNAFAVIVAAEDVEQAKPHPDGYLRALALLDGRLEPADVLAFEDTEAGVASAKAAGLRCLGVLGTLAPERLAAADEIVPAIDLPMMERLLAGARRA